MIGIPEKVPLDESLRKWSFLPQGGKRMAAGI
jgi:hypothetical protein